MWNLYYFRYEQIVRNPKCIDTKDRIVVCSRQIRFRISRNPESMVVFWGMVNWYVSRTTDHSVQRWIPLIARSRNRCTRVAFLSIHMHDGHLRSEIRCHSPHNQAVSLRIAPLPKIVRGWLDSILLIGWIAFLVCSSYLLDLNSGCLTFFIVGVTVTIRVIKEESTPPPSKHQDTFRPHDWKQRVSLLPNELHHWIVPPRLPKPRLCFPPPLFEAPSKLQLPLRDLDHWKALRASKWAAILPLQRWCTQSLAQKL